jgi:hypothetical protein
MTALCAHLRRLYSLAHRGFLCNGLYSYLA